MTEPRLTYGLDSNGRLVHVDDVLRGMACNCTCPGCGAQLIARKGEKKQHHFAHANGADCAGARMTALHMLAQQIIQDERKIRTPWFKDYYEDPSKLICFEFVLLEQRFNTAEISRRPDCVGIIKKGDKQYEVWIEIKVKHAIEEEKKKDIERLGAICMEIDLSNLLDKEYTEASVRQALFDVDDNKEWINYPQLFKKNERAEKTREYLVDLVNNWMTYGHCEDAEKIIDIIKNNPYNTPHQSAYKIIDFLVPEYNIIDWLKDTPKNTYTKKLFYCILKYYTPQLCNNLDSISIDEPLYKFKIKKFKIEKKKIELELLISLKIITALQNHPSSYNMIEKYISDEDFRNKCLKLLSIEYRHIVGSESKDFFTLAEEIYKTSPEILPLFLKALSNCYTINREMYNIPSLDDEVIKKCREYVANHKEDKENEISDLLCHAFKHIFKNQPPMRFESQIDFLDSKDMSFEEIKDGINKINEIFNKQGH